MPLPLLAPALQIAGIGTSAYGNYLASQQADRQYEQSIRAWHDEQERQKRMDSQNLQQQGVQNGLAAGNYASNQVHDSGADYLAYSRALGL